MTSNESLRSMVVNTSYQICFQNVETRYLEIFKTYTLSGKIQSER